MYIDPLFPVAECVVVVCMLLVIATYKYVVHVQYVKQYPYKVQRYLRSTDRIIRTWSQPEPAIARSKTVYVGIQVLDDGTKKPMYIKEKALYGGF